MADDINKKITIDVSVNTDGLQQLNQYETVANNLLNSFKALGKPLADASNSVSSLNKDATQVAAAVKAGVQAVQKGAATQSTTILDSAKNTISKVWGLFVKTENDKSKAATDTNAKTNTSVANSATKLQNLIGSETLQTTQDVADSSYKIITESIALQTNAKVKGLEEDKKKALSNTSLTEDAKNKIISGYAQKEKMQN
jgi:microcompartment protein CcmL/EutN